METQLTCSQVVAMLSFYVKGELNPQVEKFIKAHLEKCPSCKAKYDTFSQIVDEFSEAYKKIDKMNIRKEFATNDYSNSFSCNVSAYIDNELSDEDTFRFRKYAIVNPIVRKNLEQLFMIKNILGMSFEKTQNGFKDDFSKIILSKLDIQSEINKTETVLKTLATTFFFLFITIVSYLAVSMIY